MKGRKAELRVIEGGLDHVPRCPDHIPLAMRAEWNLIMLELSERKVMTEGMAGSVEAYIMALSNMRTAQTSIEMHGLLVPSGREGVLKQNPAVSMLGKAQQVVLRLSVELGLTPAARAKTMKPEKEEEDDLFSRMDF